MYYLKVSPTSAQQRIPLTGTPASGNGTRARFVDETGNTSQARATYLFGPLCELAVTEGGVLPTSYPPGFCSMSPLPNGTVDTHYNQPVSAAAPMVVSGVLPAGLAIVGNHLTGTPTTSGAFSFSLANGNPAFVCIASRAYSMTIGAPTAASGTISGSLTNDGGALIEGGVVRLNGTQSRKTITDANGNYHFDNVETEGFYTITPSRANYSFNPFSRSFSMVGNKTEALFTGTSTGDNANPLDTAEYFVRQQYVDVLGREPDENGFNYWSDQILACRDDASCVSKRRRDVAAAFFIEQEAQQTGSYIYDVYAGALGHRPVFNEYRLDRRQVIGGADLETEKTAFAQSFVQRAEFMAKYQANTTSESFVDALIQSVRQSSGGAGNSLGIDLSGQRDTLIATYNNGGNMDQSRALAVRAIADNPTFKQSQYNAAFVLTEYFAYLQRDAEPDGYRFWLNVLANIGGGEAGNYRGMVCSFITSAEYQKRFSSIVSHSNGECE